MKLTPAVPGYSQVKPRGLASTNSNPVQKKTTSGSFLDQLKQQQVLPNQEQDLKISKHAEARMAERDISISPETWQKINQKVNQAKTMGITDSLVLTDKEAMVVSATNKTVITVMNREEATDQIFTNINGTIILN